MSTCVICKYAPIELLISLGATIETIDEMPSNFGISEELCGSGICGFGKTLIDTSLQGNFDEIVLSDCCDVMKTVDDVLSHQKGDDYTLMLHLPHCNTDCSIDLLAKELKRFCQNYCKLHNVEFSSEAFKDAFISHNKQISALSRSKYFPKGKPHISVMGARIGHQLLEMIEDSCNLSVIDYTCMASRSINSQTLPDTFDFDELMHWYAGELLNQIPCERMVDVTSRRELIEDGALVGIIYHTLNFCDFYDIEFADIKRSCDIPMLKIESDFTLQSSGQLKTRIEAFCESLNIADSTDRASTKNSARAISTKPDNAAHTTYTRYFAGIDSGSTSTDVVIIDSADEILGSAVVPTGAYPSKSAEEALAKALEIAHIDRSNIANIVSTGYGRTNLEIGDRSVTEISCHAKGAHYLDPTITTIIDIGGQDSKAISINSTGKVVDFAMNDKCAAGTGRFLENMSRILQIDLDEMAKRGLNASEEIVISSTCTVFAESEVITLIAKGKDVDDIIYGLNRAVAQRASSLVKRISGTSPFMMTGGVAKNLGVLKALEEQLGSEVKTTNKAQLCGAIGAALYAKDMFES